MSYFNKPDLILANRAVSEGVKRGELIIIIGECSVNYIGRSYSKSGNGDRLIIIKPDRSIIIHKASGNNPVNWVKSGAVIKSNIINEKIVITAESINPRERLIINCHNINSLIINELHDNGELSIYGTEADMSQFIYNNPSIISDNFKPVSLEEQTRYGFIDVMGYDGNDLVIIECKRVSAGLSAVQQLRRYVERIKASKGINNVKGIIAAPSITKNALLMLNDFGYSFIKVEPPNRNIIDKSIQQRINDFIK